jgi:hypothetical protein
MPQAGAAGWSYWMSGRSYVGERGQPPFDPATMTASLPYAYCCVGSRRHAGSGGFYEHRGIHCTGFPRRRDFRIYVGKVLVPTLKPGDIVILDNLGSHEGETVRQLIRAEAPSFLFLRKFSPDLNPIE